MVETVVHLQDIEYRSLIYHVVTVVYWTTVTITDNGELGFDSGQQA